MLEKKKIGIYSTLNIEFFDYGFTYCFALTTKKIVIHFYLYCFHFYDQFVERSSS